MGFGNRQATAISDADLAAVPEGQALPSRKEGTLLKGSGAAIYLMQGGVKRVIPDWNTYLTMGFGNRQAAVISDADLSAIPTGQPLPRK